MDDSDKEKDDYFGSPSEIEAYARQARHDMVAVITGPRPYRCKTATVNVERRGTSVTIRWDMFLTNPRYYEVFGSMYDVMMEPNFDNINPQRLEINQRGNGKITLDLPEGSCTFFRFIFVDTRLSSAKGEKSAHAVYFQVGVPLSDEGERALEQATAPEVPRHEQIRTDLTEYLKTREAFDEMCKVVESKIKAKKLRRSEERAQIEDFRDFAQSARQRYGI